MRIWDLPPHILCRAHLLGEHRELHALWTVITKNKKGYAHHPETMRWRGKLHALYIRHEQLVKEMQRRGYIHHSLIDKQQITGKSTQNIFLLSIEKQKQLLRTKHCQCKVRSVYQ